MYNALYSHIGHINSRKSIIKIIPDFQEAVAIDDKKGSKFYSTMPFSYGERTEIGKEVYAAEDALWFIEEYQSGSYKIVITNKTPLEIETPLGEDFDKQINQLLKEVRFDYFIKKNKELRLYLYDQGSETLKIIEPFEKINICEYKYDISREDVEKTYIDRAYPVPAESCFIIAKIEKTISTHGVLIDYIQPVYQIPFDFENNYKDGIYGGEFNYEVIKLSDIILTLLLFVIRKEYKYDAYKKILNYNKAITFENSIICFKQEIIENFKKGDTCKLKKLSKILEKCN